MKINFTYNNKDYTICTVKDFTKALAKYLSTTKKPGQTKFVADFAISDILDSDEIDMSHPETIVGNVDGWYGVKELGEIGFNSSEDRQLVFDYYGGGCFKSYNINMDYYNDETFEEISEQICSALDAEEDWIIFVQWTQDECLRKDEEEAVKPIEDAAVTNFAEMLCDYVSGLDEGEGIGREDIIDHLYEYINWDKRFTREYEEGKRNFKPF